MLRIATWNVNSLRVRLECLLPWLVQDGPDVVCLQETKVTDDLFPIEVLAEVGYQVAFIGQKTYNGVALLSRLPMTDIATALPGAPPDDGKRFIAEPRRRAGDQRLRPHGQAVESPKFPYKLAWLQALNNFWRRRTHPKTLYCCAAISILPRKPVMSMTRRKSMGRFYFIPPSALPSPASWPWACATLYVCIIRRVGCIAGGSTGPWLSGEI